MKLLISLLLLGSVTSFAQINEDEVGEEVLPSRNMESPVIPSSGELSTQPSEVPGVDYAPAGPIHNETGTVPHKQEQQEGFQTGPYDENGNYQIDLKEKKSDQSE